MLKLDIFNPKMLHNCPHALGDSSNPIDGHRRPIDGIEWSLSTGGTFRCSSVAFKPLKYRSVLKYQEPSLQMTKFTTKQLVNCHKKCLLEMLLSNVFILQKVWNFNDQNVA